MVKKDRVTQYKATHLDINARKDTKDLYNQLKSQLGWNTGKAPESFLVDGTSVTAPRRMANVQLEFF